MTNKLIFASALAGAFVLVSRGEPRNLVWTGAASSDWNTTAENWYVAGDAEKTPVAFQSGDNVLFDDSAVNFTVQLKKVSSGDFQYDVGSIVFSNETQNYALKSPDSTVWYQKYGAFGPIDKWGTARVSVQGFRLDMKEDFTCHQGEWKCDTNSGSGYFGEFRSGTGSLHDNRSVSFLTNGVLTMATDFVYGYPGSDQSKVALTFDHAAVSNLTSSTSKPQHLFKATLRDSYYYGNNNTAIAFSGALNVEGTRPLVLDGFQGNVAFFKAVRVGEDPASPGQIFYKSDFADVTVADVTGDDGYDLVVTNKLADYGKLASGNMTGGGNVCPMNMLRKKGPGTLALKNNSSTTTGIVDVAEGTLVLGSTSPGEWLNRGGSSIASGVGIIDSVDGRHARYIVRDGAACVIESADSISYINNPMAWELSVSNATLRLCDRNYCHFGTLRLHNSAFEWQNAFQNTWFPYDLIGCSAKFVLSGDTPYVFEAKGEHPSNQSLADNCTFRLGFRFDSVRDDHPISEAGTEPGTEKWTKYSKFTNMWTVVDFVVEDITKDDATDATMGWTIKDMPNMSYTSLIANETWGGNPWKNYRFHGGIRKAGKGTFRTTGKNSYTHTTEVAEGTLVVDGTVASSSGLTVDAGAYLGGTGTVCAVTIKANGGFTVDVGKAGNDVLKVPSLVAEGAVVVKLTDVGKTCADFSGLKVLKLTNKPQTVDLSQWKVVESNGRRRAAFANYDPQTGIVSLVKSGVTVLIR